MIPRLAAKMNDTGQDGNQKSGINSPVEFRRNEKPLFAEGVGYLSPVVVWDF